MKIKKIIKFVFYNPIIIQFICEVSSFCSTTLSIVLFIALISLNVLLIFLFIFWFISEGISSYTHEENFSIHYVYMVIDNCPSLMNNILYVIYIIILTTVSLSFGLCCIFKIFEMFQLLDTQIQLRKKKYNDLRILFLLRNKNLK